MANTSRLLLGRRLAKHPSCPEAFPSGKTPFLPTGHSCPPGSVAGPQCTLPCPGGLPSVGLPVDRPPPLCAVSPGPTGGDTGALGGGVSYAPTSPRLF